MLIIIRNMIRVADFEETKKKYVERGTYTTMVLGQIMLVSVSLFILFQNFQISKRRKIFDTFGIAIIVFSLLFIAYNDF